MESIEWSYKLGYKIYNRPATADYFANCGTLSRFRHGSFDGAYNSGGWRPIAYRFYGDEGHSYRHWKRIERASFKMDMEVLDIYNALWGPLEKILSQASEDTEEWQKKRQGVLLHAVRILLGAVGIDYDIACEDGEKDDSHRMWMLEGLSDRWFAREVSKACGFQLKRDPEEQESGRKERQEMMQESEDER